LVTAFYLAYMSSGGTLTVFAVRRKVQDNDDETFVESGKRTSAGARIMQTRKMRMQKKAGGSQSESIAKSIVS